MLPAIMEQVGKPSGRAGEGGPRWRTLLAIALAGSGASCFDGAEALGLPCNRDDECGKGQRCELGFCGGPPATASGPESSTTAGSLGSDSSTAADSTGLVGECGNGLVEPENGEACDPGTGLDEPDCNADCTAVVCGDGYVNAAAGEECEDGNASAVDGCTPDCRMTLFWDDMDGSMSLMKWTPSIPTWDPEGTPFMLSSGWRHLPDDGRWHSGLYSVSSGTARLHSIPITFPADAGPGFRFELRFRHRTRFDGDAMDLTLGDCPAPLQGDGGVVWILEDGEPRRVGPPQEIDNPLDDIGECAAGPEPTNPLYQPGLSAYTGVSSQGLIEQRLPLPDVGGKTVELVFEVGYDCANCWEAAAPPSAGWTLDDVVVAAFPDPDAGG